MYESFHDAKVGDIVILHSKNLGSSVTSTHTISRITKEYVVLHRVFKNKDGTIYNEYDSLYRKDTGELRGIDIWNTNYITHPIKEERNAEV